MTDDLDFKNIPNGGFPNIYKLKKSDNKTSSSSTKIKREKSSNEPKIVNVKEILLKKRHTSPYLAINL